MQQGKRWKVKLLLATTLAAIAIGTHAQQSPYAGQQARPIKALSPSEVRAFLEGAGSGHAKAAELNSYPGPLHVLELAGRLDLSSAQREAMASLMARHKAEARALGAQVIRLEAELDRLFAEGKATVELVDAKTAEAGAALARYRASHLTTHVAASRLLNPAQIVLYDQLRGYRRTSGDTGPSDHDHVGAP